MPCPKGACHSMHNLRMELLGGNGRQEHVAFCAMLHTCCDRILTDLPCTCRSLLVTNAFTMHFTDCSCCIVSGAARQYWFLCGSQHQETSVVLTIPTSCEPSYAEEAEERQ